MAQALKGIEPQMVWDYFEEICQYPRPSKNEDKVAEYFRQWAKKHNFEVEEDDAGNMVIRKPATEGMEDRIPICIQGHMDMVCEKNSDVEFDFENDAIQPYIDGDWVKAKGTTLGADNGVGLAMGMVIMTGDIPHPDIELLCTRDEETGLTGAMELSDKLLKSKILINLDSEEDGTFTIGCAGGINTVGSFKYESDSVPGGSIAYEVGVKGMLGGHSGLVISSGRANALKYVNRFLYEAQKKFDLRVSSVNGGKAHNAIPREAFAVVTLPEAQEGDFKAFVEEFDKLVKNEYKTIEKKIAAEAKKVDLPDKVMTKELQTNFVSSMYAMPHGVYRMSPDIKGLVQTSTNFAVVETRDDEIFILTSQRSSLETEKVDMANTVRTSMELGGAKVWKEGGYPAWQPNMDSTILNQSVEIFKELFDKEPIIQAIHAGLENGLIGEKYPDMDMLSFGPTLLDVHSPDEKISISTTQNCWKLLLEIIKNTPKK